MIFNFLLLNGNLTHNERTLSTTNGVYSLIKLLQTVMAKEQTATAAAGGMSSEDYHSEFYNTGRIGRRNAMPDILGQHATTTTADLPDALGAMSTQDNPSIGQQQPGSSGLNNQSSTSAGNTSLNNSSSSKS